MKLNNKGHGTIPSGKDALKIIGILITLPISLPILIVMDKIKKSKK